MAMYRKGISHSGLNKYRVVTGQTWDEIEQKERAIRRQWDSEWKSKCNQSSAKERTRQAEQVQAAMDRILLDSLHISPYDFELLKDKTPYPVNPPTIPVSKKMPREPLRTDPEFNPKPSLIVKISKSKKAEFEAENQQRFDEAHQSWAANVELLQSEYQKRVDESKRKYEEWSKKKADYEEEQLNNNAEIDAFAFAVKSGKKEAVEAYIPLLLGRFSYPFEFELEMDTDYSPDAKLLILDVFLPAIESIPNVKSQTYIKSRNEWKTSYHSDAYMKKKYDSVIYQMVLQMLNACFSDIRIGSFLETVAINGRIRTIDKATGQHIEPCILSLTTDKNDFLSLNLSAIDPKAWFKSAKGVSAASLAKIAPVAPLVEISRKDKRFIEAYEVADSLDGGTNLAAMDWQDFENLIRELFEKEFSVNGGEVKITQASRDGGVDAVAFDPDPIRGGKIVIQAKRYTNVVGVSAVRDLYGTVMNEGATKGILVTTSSYGNDAYKFANGKPLTLLNGANLLYLLEKHGYRAKIDIKEAKELQKT